MSDVLVSVVIPTRNRLEMLQTAVQSAQEQTYPYREIIVVNDGSVDGTLDWLSKAAGNGLRFLSFDTSVGRCRARNAGAKTATGERLLFLDDDDWLRQDALERFMQETPWNSAPDVVYSDHFMAGDSYGLRALPEFEMRSLKGGNFIPVTALVRKASFDAVGGFDPEFDLGHEDWALWLALARAGAKFQHISVPLWWYRQHAGMWTRQDDAIKTFKLLTRKFPELYSMG